MPRCKYCNELKPPAECFQDPKFPSNQYCSENHWELFTKAKEKKQMVDTSKQKKISSKPKAKPKPQPKSDRVQLTDYIKEIWPVEPNWQWMGKQIESVCKEHDINYNDMRFVIRYCIEFEEMQVDPSFGLGQFFPRYIQGAFNFRDEVRSIKSNLLSIVFEDEYQPVPIGRPKLRRRLKEDVGF